MKKNDKVNLTINNYGCNAEGVAKCGGEAIFVPYSLTAENLDCTIIKANSKYAIAKIDAINSPSPLRIPAPCPYYSKCGGCQLQHTTYQNALNIKTQIVQNAITNVAKINYTIPQTIGCEAQYHYRNKIALPINPKTKKLGMYRPNSHNIVDIDDCLLNQDLISKLLPIINKYLSLTKNSIYNDLTKHGLLKSIVARQYNGKILITVVINGTSLPDSNLLISLCRDAFDDFGLDVNINTLKNNVILTNNFKHIYGLKNIEIIENGIKYYINNQSFLQVNNQIKLQMYKQIFNNIKNDTVIDAYSGAGLLSAMMAKHANQVFGIEIVGEATNLANKIKEANNISNLTNINGDCTTELPKLLNTLTNIQKENLTIVLDPPRKGCDKNVINAIANIYPAKIIYMSCDPSTLARDLNLLLSQKNYKIKQIQPYDMFPQTKHIETLAVLEK